MLKARLASDKLHIDAKCLERGILMPRDIDGGADKKYPSFE